MSPGCFAWILCCLLQMHREEIEWPHLTPRVNYKSNNSTHSFLISNTILLLQAKNIWQTANELEIHSSEPKQGWRKDWATFDTHQDFHLLEPHHRALTSPQPWALNSSISHIARLWGYFISGWANVFYSHYSSVLAKGYCADHSFSARRIPVFWEMFSFYSLWMLSLTTKR